MFLIYDCFWYLKFWVMAISCLNQIEDRWFCLEIDSDLNSIVRKARQIDSIPINPSSFRKEKTQDSFDAWMICYPQKNDTPLFFYVFGDPGATRCAQWQAAILLLKNLRISQARESSGWWVFVRLRWKNHHEHPSTLWGKRSSNYFCTHFCVLHGKNISGCLGLSCFLHGSQWISMNLFQKKLIKWLHIRINNFDHFRYFLVVKIHHEWHGLKVQPSFIAFSTTLLACSRSSQWKAWKHIGDTPKNIQDA